MYVFLWHHALYIQIHLPFRNPFEKAQFESGSQFNVVSRAGASWRPICFNLLSFFRAVRCQLASVLSPGRRRWTVCSISSCYKKNVVSTAAVNTLTAPLSKYNQINPAQKKRKADVRRELAARKKAALEKLLIVPTEENTALKEEVAQLKA